MDERYKIHFDFRGSYPTKVERKIFVGSKLNEFISNLIAGLALGGILPAKKQTSAIAKMVEKKAEKPFYDFEKIRFYLSELVQKRKKVKELEQEIEFFRKNTIRFLTSIRESEQIIDFLIQQRKYLFSQIQADKELLEKLKLDVRELELAKKLGSDVNTELHRRILFLREQIESQKDLFEKQLQKQKVDFDDAIRSSQRELAETKYLLSLERDVNTNLNLRILELQKTIAELNQKRFADIDEFIQKVEEMKTKIKDQTDIFVEKLKGKIAGKIDEFKTALTAAVWKATALPYGTFRKEFSGKINIEKTYRKILNTYDLELAGIKGVFDVPAPGLHELERSALKTNIQTILKSLERNRRHFPLLFKFGLPEHFRLYHLLSSEILKPQKAFFLLEVLEKFTARTLSVELLRNFGLLSYLSTDMIKRVNSMIIFANEYARRRLLRQGIIYEQTKKRTISQEEIELALREIEENRDLLRQMKEEDTFLDLEKLLEFGKLMEE